MQRAAKPGGQPGHKGRGASLRDNPDEIIPYHFIPALRTKQLMKVFGVELSTGTLDNFRKSASRNLKSFMEELRLSIIDSAAGFFDETGIKVRGVRHWVHVAATSLFSLFMLHPAYSDASDPPIPISSDPPLLPVSDENV